MKRYTLTPLADRDIAETAEYIARRDSLIQARTVVRAIKDKCQRLAETPGIGQVRWDIGEDIRSFHIWSYLIFYRQVDDGIEVLRVLHGARDIDETFFS